MKWEILPEHIVVRIFTYLSLSERSTASLSCKQWRQCFNSPMLWRACQFTFVDSNEFKYGKCLENHGHYLREVEVLCRQEEKINRNNACTLIRRLSSMKVRRLEKFTVTFLGENPLFYAGHEFIDCLRDLFDKPKNGCQAEIPLKSVDLSKLPIAYSDDLINLLAENNSDLESLNIQNAGLICKVSSSCIYNVVTKCRKLKSLALHHTSITEEIMLLLTEDDRTQRLEHLSIDCRREEKFGKDITSDVWRHVTQKIPSLRVTLAFDCSCPMFKVDAILKPEVPVKNLRLEVMSRVVSQVYFAAVNYSETLERLTISTTSSEDLERALIYLVANCHKLCELCVLQCTISQGTKQKIQEIRPRMEKLFMKTKR
ncbi:F-box/LRR-repeat protein 8-like [Montipora capricornis]|uniref:F-box/LRR-repeat protein 8-like n=1 Tax=Montipora foliosa TaxID=591990 RepID=UPI0035F0FE47